MRSVGELMAPGATLDQRSWRAARRFRLTRGTPVVSLYAETSHPFADLDLNVPGDERLPFERLRGYVEWTAVGRTRRAAIVEPRYGWVISDPLFLHPRSMHQRSMTAGVPLYVPTIRRHAIDRVRRPKVRLRGELASLRFVADANYFHFLTELIGGRMRLAHSYVPVDVPVLVGGNLAKRRYFRDAVDMGAFGGRRIVVQEDEFVRADHVYLFDTPRYGRDSLEYVRNVFQVPDSDPKTATRLYLTRGASTRRVIANEADLRPVLERCGFQVVDPAQLTIPRQIELFSTAGCVVGVHGAGLTNVVFRRNAPLSLLEIFPPAALKEGMPRAHYYFICRTAGFDYEALIGTEVAGAGDRWDAAFSVDPARFEATILRLLDRL